MDDFKVYRSYTTAFKYPLVIGKVDGVQLPFRFTVHQAGMFLVLALTGIKTQSLWSRIIPFSGAIEIMAVVAISLWASWFIQYQNIEGRHPLHYLIGVLKYHSKQYVQRNRSETSAFKISDHHILNFTAGHAASLINSDPQPPTPTPCKETTEMLPAGWEVLLDGTSGSAPLVGGGSR